MAVASENAGRQVPGPETYFPQEWVQSIRKDVNEAEALGRLTPGQMLLLQEKGLFQLLIPASIGGKEYDLPELMRAEEAAAWVDGSVGWVIALGGGAGFFAGFVELPTAKALFQRDDICVAVTGFPAGTALPVDGGYLVNGHWRYASGAPHAKLYTANAVLPDGEIRAMIFMPDQVQLADGWKSLGLRATASQDMIIKDAFVPMERSFILSKPFPHAQGPLFQYPFHQQAEALLSITSMGMGRRFLDFFRDSIIPKYKRKDQIQSVYQEAESEFSNARSRLYDAVIASWMPYKKRADANSGADAGQGADANPGADARRGVDERGDAGDTHGDGHLAEERAQAVGVAARDAARTALMVSDRLYPLGGMEMMQMGSGINRVWRDIHTASQHTLLAPISKEG